jgi:RNA polymerase sigma factor (sigma-70 family)
MEWRHRSADTSAHPDRFESTVVVNMDAAYNLAYWLTGNDSDAEDLIQEACLRAFRFLDTFRGGNSKAWLLTIVRNTYYSDLKKHRLDTLTVPLDENDAQDQAAEAEWLVDAGQDVVAFLERQDTKRLVGQALAHVPEQFREVVLLRDLEELSYQEIARIAQIPLGTVMSRLSRGRKLLARALQQLQNA